MPKHKLRKLLSHILMFVVMSVLSDGQARRGIRDSVNSRMPIAAQTLGAGGGAASAHDSPIVVCNGNQLKIATNNSTLASVLAEVQKCTGAKIDIPDGVAASRVFNQYGPGPAREVIVALLNSAGYDYVIGASRSDPEKVETVLLLIRQDNTPVEDPHNAKTPVWREYLQAREDGKSSSLPADATASPITEGGDAKAKATLEATPIEQTAADEGRTPAGNKASVPGTADQAGLASASSTPPNVRMKPTPPMNTLGQIRFPAMVLIKEARWRDELDRFSINMDASEGGVNSLSVGDDVSTKRRKLTSYPVSIESIPNFRGNTGALGVILVPIVDQRQMADGELRAIRDGNSRLSGYAYPAPRDSDAANYIVGTSGALRVRINTPTGYAASWEELGEAIWQADRQLEFIVPGTLTIVIMFVQMAVRLLMRAKVVLFFVSFASISAIWSLYYMHCNLTWMVWASMIAIFGIYIEAVIVRLVCSKPASKQTMTRDSLRDVGRTAQGCSFGRPQRTEPRFHGVLDYHKWFAYRKVIQQRGLGSEKTNWTTVVGGSIS